MLRRFNNCFYFDVLYESNYINVKNNKVNNQIIWNILKT